jgi:hypothetical protein
LMAWFRLARGSAASSIGESSIVEAGAYLGVAVSGAPAPDMKWSSSGNVWLRGRCELPDVVAGRIGRAVNGGTNGFGATPESGVKKGDVGLKGPTGENEEGAVSVKALCNELVLSEWNGPCPPYEST